MALKRHSREIGRRGFLRASTSALVGGWALVRGAGAAEGTADAIAEAVRKVGRLPRRPLGGSGREISALVGATDWDPETIEAALGCGVNYWHKAQRFQLSPEPGGRSRTTPQALIKEREANYCEVVVDRVRGNHETGEIDEEAHYQFVKQAVAESGLRYYDDMIFHFGYHNVAEYRANRAFVRAYERLKKEGLVRHLGMTQHHYNGNAKVPGGESANEILSAVMADGLYEHAQFFYSYGESPEVEAFVRAARDKGFGTIAMKTTRGIGRMQAEAEFMKTLPAGVSPYHALARWLTTETPLTAAVIRLRGLTEFADTFSGAGKALRSADRAALTRMAAYADRNACRLCNECLGGCPVSMPIADVLRCERYALDLHDVPKARRLYAELGRPAARCRNCRTCVSRCPQGLAIPEKLGETHRLLG